MPGPKIQFTYKNHRGEVALRTVTVDAIEFQPAHEDYGYAAGWFVSGYCHTKNARRSFAFANIQFEPNQQGVFALLRF